MDFNLTIYSKTYGVSVGVWVRQFNPKNNNTPLKINTNIITIASYSLLVYPHIEIP